MITRDYACDLARQRASSDLDGELSEFDRHLLGRHLDRCADCRHFVQETATLTEVLRTAPLDPYVCGRVAAPRVRGARVRQIAPVAAAILVVSTAATTLVSGGRREQPALSPITAHKPIATRVGYVAARVKLPIGQRSAGTDF